MNRTSGNRRIARKAAMVATALGLWVGLVLLFATPLALTGPISWRQAVSFGASFWALWLLFLPAVAWLCFHFPIERATLLRNAALHVLTCLLIVGSSKATFRAAARILPSAQGSPHRSEMPGRSPGVRIHMPSPSGSFRPFLALRAALDVLVYWSVLGVCQGIRSFRISREREQRARDLEARLTSAKLQALRMQINPHFLFNTLNSIAALVYVNPRGADEMLGDLSQLLRRSLDSMEEQEVPLAQELEFIGAYLSIEQKRFGERLRAEQSVPDELMKALVPALLLQPLVENAIRHGIEPQRAPGLIFIEAKQEGKHLHLIVRDNGSGLPCGTSDNPGRRGIGLANTHARLQGLYGPNQRFNVSMAEPQGCQIDIHLPFHLEPVQVATIWGEQTA
jgi:two-component system LytT family sensor kinase